LNISTRKREKTEGKKKGSREGRQRGKKEKKGICYSCETTRYRQFTVEKKRLKYLGIVNKIEGPIFIF